MPCSISPRYVDTFRPDQTGRHGERLRHARFVVCTVVVPYVHIDCVAINSHFYFIYAMKMVEWVSTWMSEGSFHMSVSRYHLALIMSYNKQNTYKIGLEWIIQTWNIPIEGGLLSNYGTRVLHNCIRCIFGNSFGHNLIMQKSNIFYHQVKRVC